MSSPSVNTQANAAEQANQVQGEQYNTQQQAAAQKALADWQKQNPNPLAAGLAQPIAQPASSTPAQPTSFGGGNFSGGQGATTAPVAGQSQNAPQAPAAPQGMPQGQQKTQMNPQMLQQLMAKLQAQKGAAGVAQ